MLDVSRESDQKALVDVHFSADGRNLIIQNIDGVIRKWDKAGGKPLKGLTKRRQAERKLFLS